MSITGNNFYYDGVSNYGAYFAGELLTISPDVPDHITETLTGIDPNGKEFSYEVQHQIQEITVNYAGQTKTYIAGSSNSEPLSFESISGGNYTATAKYADTDEIRNASGIVPAPISRDASLSFHLVYDGTDLVASSNIYTDTDSKYVWFVDGSWFATTNENTLTFDTTTLENSIIQVGITNYGLVGESTLSVDFYSLPYSANTNFSLTYPAPYAELDSPEYLAGSLKILDAAQNTVVSLKAGLMQQGGFQVNENITINYNINTGRWELSQLTFPLS